MTGQLKCKRCGDVGIPFVEQRSGNYVASCKVCHAFIKNIPYKDLYLYNVAESENNEPEPTVGDRVSFLESLVEDLTERISKLEDNVEKGHQNQH